MNKILVLLILLFFISTVHAQTLVPVPAPQGYVTDLAGVLAEQRAAIEEELYQLDLNTGVQIAVLTIPSTQGEDVFDFSSRVFEVWKPGDAEKDNGLLIVLATEDRAYFVQTGYGLEGVLPDSLVGRVAREEMVPFFKEGNFGEGIAAGVHAYAGIVRQDPDVISHYPNEDVPIEFEAFNQGFLIVGLAVLLFVLLLVKLWVGLHHPAKFAVQALGVVMAGFFSTFIGGFLSLLMVGGFYGFTLTSILFFYWLVFGSVPLFTATNSTGGSRGGFWGGGLGGFGSGGSSGGGSFGGFGGGMSGGGGAGGRF